ncbi:MAG: GLPGLI family protein [Flavobacteriaceae bacterium]|jgi:GLPGLI family protein|nr:GLPGLI family protein [Flavobacteriaceae bacterium]
MHRKIIKTLILSLIFSNLYSQNLKINYQLTYKPDSTSSETKSKNMLLLIQGIDSKFISEKQYQVDSLRNSGFKGSIAGDNSLLAVNYGQDLSLKYYVVFIDTYKVAESVQFDWKLEPETMKIDIYSCQKATLKYKGRTWDAWFTQDVPIPAGPYIFRGLPGLIVSMKDSTDSYNFSLSAIKKMSEVLDFKDTYPKAIDVSRKQLTKVFLDYYSDPYKEMKAGNLHVKKMKVIDEQGREIEPDFRQLTEIMQTSLKKNNNPIELSEAVRYPD